MRSALTRRPDLFHRAMFGADSGRVDDVKRMHRVIRVDRHRGLRILPAKCSTHLAIEVNLSGRRSGHRRALLPDIDPPAVSRVGVGKVRIDISAIVLELVEHERACLLYTSDAADE